MALFTLTYNEAIDLLALAVKDRGKDFVYRKKNPEASCQYFHGNKPGCIIGWILDHKGVTLKDLIEGDGYNLNTSAVGTLIARGLIEVDDPSTEILLADVQRNQDCQTPWGEAVALAKNN
jgi:hypothetical protein